MSELAYDAEGDRFEVPANAAGWRVRRFRNVGARGAPEVVFGEDGRPLVLPVDAGIDEFRVAVAGVPGRYRLDPVDANGRVVEKVPAAYLQFGETPRSPSGGGALTAMSAHDGMLGEVVRANAEMVKVIADRFGGVMEAAATLLKAADGAGLPARKPIEPLRNAGDGGDGGDDDEDDDEDDDDEDREPGLGDFIGQVMPLVQMVMARQSAAKAPRLVRNAGSAARAARVAQDDKERAGPAAPPPAKSSSSPPSPAKQVAGAITPAMLVHFQAIQAELTAEEAEFARAVAAELGAAEIQEWMAELAGMSVEDAVAMVRSFIAGKGGAS